MVPKGRRTKSRYMGNNTASRYTQLNLLGIDSPSGAQELGRLHRDHHLHGQPGERSAMLTLQCHQGQYITRVIREIEKARRKGIKSNSGYHTRTQSNRRSTGLAKQAAGWDESSKSVSWTYALTAKTYLRLKQRKAVQKQRARELGTK